MGLLCVKGEGAMLTVCAAQDLTPFSRSASSGKYRYRRRYRRLHGSTSRSIHPIAAAYPTEMLFKF